MLVLLEVWMVQMGEPVSKSLNIWLRIYLCWIFSAPGRLKFLRELRCWLVGLPGSLVTGESPQKWIPISIHHKWISLVAGHRCWSHLVAWLNHMLVKIGIFPKVGMKIRTTLTLQTSKKRRVRYKTSVLLWKTWVLGKHGFSVLLYSYQLSFGSLPNQIYYNLFKFGACNVGRRTMIRIEISQKILKKSIKI